MAQEPVKTDANAQQRDRQARESAEASRKNAAQAVADRRKAAEDANSETQRRMDQSTPTPTQEENDLAKVGALDIDSKQDDGSGPDVAPAQVQQSRSVEANQSGSAPYQTRVASKKD